MVLIYKIKNIQGLVFFVNKKRELLMTTQAIILYKILNDFLCKQEF
jgi:hypothetical protein